jgi:hypothetical protein
MKWLTPRPRAGVAEVAVVEAVAGIVAREVVERGWIDEQRERHLAVIFYDEQLLARASIRCEPVARRLVDDEIVDGDAGVDAIQGLEAALHAVQH